MYTEAGTWDMVRKILHFDLDAFFCAVEAQRDASLRGKAFAVGGRPDQRGVVASCSYPARRFGVRSAMPMATALRLCPDLIIVPHDHAAYHEASHAVMARLRDLTPLVEQLSIDEAFLDVSMLPQAVETVARRLQATINDELRLPCSLGAATNKLVAKIANNVGKAGAQGDDPPNAIKVVPPGQEATFLAPLPITDLWGVGPKTAEKLIELGMHTIGDVALWPEDDLIRRFGKHGRDLARHARGIDERPVEPVHEAKSISKETTFARDVRDGAKLRRVLRRLAEGVGRQVRQSGLRGATVKLKLRWADFTTLTRQVTLEHPTDQDAEICAAALRLFEQNWPEGRPVRLIGVGVSGFEDPQAEAPHRQLGLWDDVDEIEQARRLQAALDELRDRFGDEAIQRGSDL
ncbi:MAG: DNA polymerase IV [Anaerolineae bacterium]|nr:DNA polymerase IV [Anaerolineae bacterium]